jgi:hypothetical protein
VQPTPGPAGEYIYTAQGTIPAWPAAFEHFVGVEKPDGTRITIYAINWDQNEYTGGRPTVRRPTPPMTVDQMIQLALTPGLTLFP